MNIEIIPIGLQEIFLFLIVLIGLGSNLPGCHSHESSLRHCSEYLFSYLLIQKIVYLVACKNFEISFDLILQNK